MLRREKGNPPNVTLVGSELIRTAGKHGDEEHRNRVSGRGGARWGNSRSAARACKRNRDTEAEKNVWRVQLIDADDVCGKRWRYAYRSAVTVQPPHHRR